MSSAALLVVDRAAFRDGRSSSWARPDARLDLGLMLDVSRSLQDGAPTRSGLELEQLIVRWHAQLDQRDVFNSKLRRVLTQLNDEIEMSPRPAGEWGPVLDTLGEELTGHVLGTSPSSLRRYRSGQRDTPQDVAERLHFLALLLADLAGSYNEYGIRRWFSRPRVQLDGHTPKELLGVAFQPDGADARRIQALAQHLVGS